MSCDPDHGDIEIIQGSSKQFALLVRSADTNAAFDLTGSQLWCTVKASHRDVAPIVLKRTLNAGGSDSQILILTPQSGSTAGVPNVGRASIFFTPVDSSRLKVEKDFWIDVWAVLLNGEQRPVVSRRRVVVLPRITVITA